LDPNASTAAAAHKQQAAAMSVTSVPSLSFPQAHRRRLLILLVVSLALARSSSYKLSNLSDAVSLQSWRDSRRRRTDAQKRRELETPL